MAEVQVRQLGLDVKEYFIELPGNRMVSVHVNNHNFCRAIVLGSPMEPEEIESGIARKASGSCFWEGRTFFWSALTPTAMTALGQIIAYIEKERKDEESTRLLGRNSKKSSERN